MSAELETDAGQAGEIAEGRARPGWHGRPGAAGAAWAADVARARNGSRKPNRLAAFIFQLLAAIGFGISIALVVPTLGASALAAPGGLLLAGGRIAGMAGTYLLLVTDRHRGAHPRARTRRRPGQARRLAPRARALDPDPARRARSPAHLRLRPRRQDRRAARDRRPDHDLPRHAGRGGRPRPPRPGRRDELPLRAPQDALRDLVVGPPLHVPGGGDLAVAPVRHRHAVRRTPRGHRLVGRPVGAHRRRRPGLPRRACRWCAATGTGSGS